MNPTLQQILQTGTVTDGVRTYPLRKDGRACHVDETVGALLQRLVEQVQPSSILEVGMAYGLSTLYLGEALARLPQAVTHIVIDPFQHERWNAVGLHNVRTAGYDGPITFFEEPSELVLPRLLAAATTVDFAFIDGFHTFDQCLVDFYFIDRMLRLGGVVVFDDADFRSVGRVIRLVLSYGSYVIAATTKDAMPMTRLSRAKRKLVQLAGLERLIRPEVLHPDWALGLAGRAVALQKIAIVKRDTQWYRDF